MKKLTIAVLWAVMMVLDAGAVGVTLGVSQGDDDVPELKKAIVMVYYGTSDDSVRAVSIDALTARVRQAFPDVEVREAWTCRAAADALGRRTGLVRPRVQHALQQLEADGYNSVIVGIGELIEGKDVRVVERTIEQMRPSFFEIKHTQPLLYSADDCKQVMQLLVEKTAPAADEQVVFVGHGRDEAYNDVYCLADYVLQQEGMTCSAQGDACSSKNCHVGTIAGYPSLDNVKRILRQTGTRQVVLAPLIMMTAGRATKDIFKTWREALEAEGYSVRLVRRGVCDYPEIQQLIVDKIRRADQQP